MTRRDRMPAGERPDGSRVTYEPLPPAEDGAERCRQVRVMPDGTVFKEELKGGLRHGLSVGLLPDGWRLEMIWNEGARPVDGRCVEIKPDGTRKVWTDALFIDACGDGARAIVEVELEQAEQWMRTPSVATPRPATI